MLQVKGEPLFLEADRFRCDAILETEIFDLGAPRRIKKTVHGPVVPVLADMEIALVPPEAVEMRPRC